MNALETITELSHEFGSEEYVLGGGGNSSCKDRQALWIKPSGTTLAGITPEDFVALDREKMKAVSAMQPPADASAREAMIKELMMKAVRSESAGKRPSVESPLHDAFEAEFVVHTHPCLVNGLTCAQEGEEACRRLFPEALWIPYVDPGYTLSVTVRDAMDTYRRAKGQEPAMILIQNHGVFVGADEAEGVRHHYRRLMEALAAAYAEAGISSELEEAAPPSAEEVAETRRLLQAIVGAEDAAFVAASGRFEPATGPLTPDHMVYSRAFPYLGAPSEQGMEAFRDEQGYFPKVVVAPNAVYGMGKSPNDARLALELAKDGARVKKLAGAFGGVRYMDRAAREFIENWEVEAYRKSVSAG